MTVSEFVREVESKTNRKAKRNGRGFMCSCPVPDHGGDKNPSLSVSQGDDGRVLVHCFKGCEPVAITAAVGRTVADLMPRDTKRNGRAQPRANKLKSSRPIAEYSSLEAAVEALEKERGRMASIVFTYADGHYESTGAVVRWNRPEGGKDIAQVSRKGSGGWVHRAMPEPRPLYRLPEFEDADLVLVTEGEPACEALRSLGFIATTSAGGASAPHKTDWCPLSGKACIIWPDNDDPGEKYLDRVAPTLAALNPAATIRVTRPMGLPEGGDAVDFIESRRSAGVDDDQIRAEILRLIDDAEAYTPEPVTPGPIPFRPFPVEALPEPDRSFVVAVSKGIGCDASNVALPMIAACAAAIGATRVIRIHDEWYEPCIVWVGCIGESGTLKTPAFKRVVRIVRDAESVDVRKHEDAMAVYDRDVLLYEKDLAAWKKDKGWDGDPPEKPVMPICKRLQVSDATTESMARVLSENPRGVLYDSDELSALITSIDCYKGGRGGDAQFWLSAHDAEGCTVDRKGASRPIFVHRPAVSICGGIQPGTLKRVMTQEHLDSGMMPRLLVEHPPMRKPYYSEFMVPERVDRQVADVFAMLWALDFRDDDDEDVTHRPIIVGLTADAKAEGIRFVNAIADDLADTTGALRAALSKIKGAAYRLALIIHLTRSAAGDRTVADANTVDAASMRAGITLAWWFANEARRLYGAWNETQEQGERRELAEWIGLRGGVVTVSELWHGRRKFRDDPDGARAALAELVKMGWGRWEACGARKMGRPSERFALTVTVTETPAGAGTNRGFRDSDTREALRNDNAGLSDNGRACGDGPPSKNHNASHEAEGTVPVTVTNSNENDPQGVRFSDSDDGPSVAVNDNIPELQGFVAPDLDGADLNLATD